MTSKYNDGAKKHGALDKKYINLQCKEERNMTCSTLVEKEDASAKGGRECNGHKHCVNGNHQVQLI